MARHGRMLSENMIYHIVMKGINGNRIFIKENDYTSFLKYFKEACSDYDVDILAYCIMDNHVHFMLKFNADTMSEMFKSFGAKYVPKYNANHSRIGPLFNGRYYSSPINDDRYLLSVLRYIHYNPVKAGICKLPGDYKWSSYNEYFEHNSVIADIEYVEKLYSENELKMLHIVDDELLDEVLIFNSWIYGADDNELVDFLKRNKSRDKGEIISIFNRAKVSKTRTSQFLKIDKRNL